MKKALHKAPKASQTVEVNNPPSSQGALPDGKPNVKDAVRAVSASAREIFGKAHQLDESADSVDAEARAAHQIASAVHSQTAGPAPAPEGGEIVIDEKQRGKGTPFPIVGIGASAGGYEAFAEFLRNLSTSTGMAFVLVQHLDPKHKSQLSELLGRSSKLPVLAARHDIEVLPDQIYVIPENSNLTIAEGKLRLHPRKETEGPPMPIDMFFRSLAQQQQNRAIGIVLSGTGCDGTLGIEAIKGEGGITFAQDDRSSKFYGMPGSAIATGAVDFVLPPDEIAKELTQLSRHPLVGRAPRPGPVAVEAAELERLLRESPNEITTLFRLLRARTGVDFSLYKQSTLKRRIIRRMVLHKKDVLEQYMKLVESNPAELDALFNDLLINVTSFFRDPRTFAILKKKFFPRIIKAHTDDGPLRFWVCGCSTGEEAYSLAMALIEYFDQNRTHRHAQIFATDISDQGIERARAGIYPPNIQQDVSPERLRRFFTKVNGNFQVYKSIRDMCVFARQNVLVDPPFSNLDLLSCRNVLIYFGPALQRRVVPLFHYALRNAGLLLLGNSETIGPATDHFCVLDKKHKIYTKKIGYAKPGFDVPIRPPQEPEQMTPRAGTGARLLDNKHLNLQQEIDRLLLLEFSPPMVVVNSQMDVVHFRGRTGRYLEHAPGSASLNLFKMLHDDLSVNVRAAVSKASRQDQAVSHAGIEIRRNSDVFELTIDVVPFRIEPLDDRFFAIVFRESAAPIPAAQAAGKGSGAGSNRLRQELSRVKLDLMGTKESMQSIIEEQEATNEELKSANEEIQSSNEELQSTNEELETAKEELQSTNEELTTLNEELQNRNVELSQVNNDLLNLLASVNIPILMVGNDLTIRRFTPMAERLFNLIPSDVGRRLSDLNRSLLMPDLDKTIRQVIDDLSIVEREIQDRNGHWYLLRIRPYRTRDNKIEGAVIVLIDVDELRQALEVMLGMVHQPLLMLGADLKVRSANQSFLQTFGLMADQTVGRLIYEMSDKQWDLPQLHTLLDEILTRKRQVSDFPLEANFPKAGFRKLRLSASRFFEEGKGMPLILLAMQEE
jgi:two-component system, chemotaxis family, CheB/CheR fusion protein